MPGIRWSILSLLLSAATLAQAQSPCMPISDARGVAVSGPRQLLIDAGERAWRLDLATDCPAALGASKIRFISARSDRSICAGSGDQINADQTTCVVDSVSPLDPQTLKQAVAYMNDPARAATATVAAESADAAAGEPGCFDPTAIRRWHQVDRQTLEVDVRHQGRFRIHLANSCRELMDANDAKFSSRLGRQFCGHGTDLVFPLRTPNGLGPSPRLLRSRIEGQGCPVQRVERLLAARTE